MNLFYPFLDMGGCYLRWFIFRRCDMLSENIVVSYKMFDSEVVQMWEVFVLK